MAAPFPIVKAAQAVDAESWLSQSNLNISLATPVAFPSDARRRQLGRVKVAKHLARSWRVTMSPMRFVDPANDITDPALGGQVPEVTLGWGFDGAQQEARIDYPCAGGTIQVWGDSVDATVLLPSFWQSASANAGAAVNFGCTIVPGEAMGGPRATFTVNTQIIAVGAFTLPIPIPAMARSFRWMQNVNLSVGNVPVPLFFSTTMDAGGASVCQTTPAGYTTDERTWPTSDGLMLAPEARFLFVQNQGAVGQTISLRIQFVLDLA